MPPKWPICLGWGEELVLDWPIGGQYRYRWRPIGAQSLYRFNISTLLSFSFSRSFRIFLHFVFNHFSIERAPFSLDFYFTFVPCFILFFPLYSSVFHYLFFCVSLFILVCSMLVSFLLHALFLICCFMIYFFCSMLYSFLFHAFFHFCSMNYSFLVSYFIFFILYSYLFQAFCISVPWISFFLFPCFIILYPSFILHCFNFNHCYCKLFSFLFYAWTMN